MPENGADLVVNVEDPGSPGTYVPVNDMNSYNKNSSRDRTTYPVFMRTIPHTLVAPREVSFTLSGYLAMTDPGQQILRTAEENDTVANIEVLPDGTNGFRQDVRVGTRTHDADPEAFQEVSFEMAAADDPVQVGSGPII